MSSALSRSQAAFSATRPLPSLAPHVSALRLDRESALVCSVSPGVCFALSTRAANHVLVWVLARSLRCNQELDHGSHYGAAVALVLVGLFVGLEVLLPPYLPCCACRVAIPVRCVQAAGFRSSGGLPTNNLTFSARNPRRSGPLQPITIELGVECVYPTTEPTVAALQQLARSFDELLARTPSMCSQRPARQTTPFFYFFDPRANMAAPPPSPPLPITIVAIGFAHRICGWLYRTLPPYPPRGHPAVPL